jgi:hypothetical protein
MANKVDGFSALSRTSTGQTVRFRIEIWPEGAYLYIFFGSEDWPSQDYYCFDVPSAKLTACDFSHSDDLTWTAEQWDKSFSRPNFNAS